MCYLPRYTEAKHLCHHFCRSLRLGKESFVRYHIIQLDITMCAQMDPPKYNYVVNLVQE